MTSFRVRALSCDRDGCQALYAGLPGDYQSETTRRAKSAGWTIVQTPRRLSDGTLDRAHIHLCPEHKPRGPVTP